MESGYRLRGGDDRSVRDRGWCTQYRADLEPIY